MAIFNFLNQESAILIFSFIVMAFFVSPLSPLARSIREGVVMFYLPAIVIFVFCRFVQIDHYVHDVFGHHYGFGMRYNSSFEDMMNLTVCYAFGFAFSIQAIRRSRGWLRIIGGLFSALFAVLILLWLGMFPLPRATS